MEHDWIHIHDWVIAGWTHDGPYQLIQWKCKAKGCGHYDRRMRLTGYTWTRAVKPNVANGLKVAP